MEITLRKGMGNPILNAVRSAAFFSCPVVRPVAFKVGGESNVLSISDTVIEDMTTFISTVSRFNYAYNGNSKLIVAKCECDGELRLSELLAGSGVTSDLDSIVLHSTSAITVEVIFMKSAGNFTSLENTKLIQDAGYDGYVVVNSRHCNVESFTFKHLSEDRQTETFEVSIKTLDGRSAEATIKDAIGLLIGEVQTLQTHL